MGGPHPLRRGLRGHGGLVSLIPALGGPVELIAKAAIGGAVYAAVALTVNAAGVRDTGRRLLNAYRTRGAEA